MKQLAIVGYGQMGKLIEQLSSQFDFSICAVIDPLVNTELTDPDLDKADVCIEFSTPTAVVKNLEKLIQMKKHVVCGTTGWQQHLAQIQKLVKQNNTGLLYGSNFSFGMNLFYQIVLQSCKLMNSAEGYDPFGLEYHHKRKQDSPSGTARLLSDIVLNNITRKATAQFEKLDRKIENQEFHFASLRAGEIPGTHLIGFDSESDTIELKHTTRNRNGLAIGALKAAQWLEDKKGLFNFSDIFQEILRY